MQSEVAGLRAYASALQKQNQAKTQQQVILYRQFQNMKTELLTLQKYYHRSRQLSKQTNLLKLQLLHKNEEYLTIVNSLTKNQETYLGVNCKLQQEIRENSKVIFELREKLNQAFLRQRELYRQIQLNSYELTEEQIKNEELIRTIHGRQAVIQELSKHIQQLQQRHHQQMEKQRPQNLQQQYGEEEQSNDNNKMGGDFLRNYEHLQSTLFIKDKRIRQMEDYIGDLEQSCEELNNELSKMQSKEKKLQSYIKRLNKRLEETTDNAQNQHLFIQKKSSLSQNNRFDTSSQRSQKSSEQRFSIRNSNNGNSQKENSNLASNMTGGGGSQRLVASECVYYGKNIKNSSNKLKLRVEALKKQNLKLLKQIS